MLIFHKPHEYDSHKPYTTNSDWTDIGDQEPLIEEVNIYNPIAYDNHNFG